jgi:hypothetical protein
MAGYRRIYLQLNNKIMYTIKGNGSIEYGKKIIKFFESLGGVNEYNLKATGKKYYFIKEDFIFADDDKPENLKEVELLENGMAKGVWYKDFNGDYFKPKYINKKGFTTTEAVIFENAVFDFISNSWDYDNEDIKNGTPLTDLTEIQKFLPDGHEDKSKEFYTSSECNVTRNHDRITSIGNDIFKINLPKGESIIDDLEVYNSICDKLNPIDGKDLLSLKPEPKVIIDSNDLTIKNYGSIKKSIKQLKKLI